jgi:AcrR family transcriptional regulator
VTAQKRPTLSERRAEQFRLDIAMAARDIFLAEGSTSATVERICEAVGIAPRTFHRHFPVKEDVVMPLFREFGRLSIQSLQQAPSESDPVDTLVEAFGTEVPRRGQVEIDRRFLELMLRAPQYRLRWLDWGEDLAAPISDFLAARYDLGTDAFRRDLPGHLVIQTCRQAYVYWVEDGDFDHLKSALRTGVEMIVAALAPLSTGQRSSRTSRSPRR